MKQKGLPLILVLLLGACSRGGLVTDRGVLVPEKPDGNVTLYISNQDRSTDPLDVRVLLDGAPIIRASIAIGQIHPSYEAYHFNWQPGVHELRIESTRVSAKLVSKVEVKAKHWVSVLYGYPPNAGDFILQVYDEEPAWL